MVPRKIGRREGTEAKYGRNSRVLLEGFRCEAEGVEKFLNTHICMCQVRPHTYRFYTYILHTWIPFVCDTSARQRRYHTVVVVSSLRIERQSKSNNQTCWRTKARPSRAKKTISVLRCAPALDSSLTTMNDRPPASSSSSDVVAAPPDDSSDHDQDTATLQITREPFWAFIPKVATWAGGIVAGEAETAAKAVTGAPAWTVAYLQDTIAFYQENPRTLANEVSMVVGYGIVFR